MGKSRDDNEGNTVHIGQAIQSLLSTYHIKTKFDEASLINSWERLVGKPIAKRTKKVYIRNKVLFVELDSPSLKHDLGMHKSKILDILKKEFGNEAVQEIILM